MQHNTWSKDRNDLASLTSGVLNESHEQGELNLGDTPLKEDSHDAETVGGFAEMKNRIEGLIHQSMLSDFDAIVTQLIDDLLQEEPFEAEDIVKYLSERMALRHE